MPQNISSKRASGFSAHGGIEVTIAPNAGACFGVVRAIKLGEQALTRKKQGDASRVYSFGPLIHNPTVVARLQSAGMTTVENEQSVEGGTVVLRSHGVRKEIESVLRDRGVKIVDATCPLVKKPQRIAESLAEKGYFLVLVGDVKHPEIKGVLSYYGREDYLVTYHCDDVEKIPEGVEKVGVIAQTTIEATVFEAVVEKCRERFADVVVYNTICDATAIRQSEAAELSRTADVVIVVGGRNSSNTNKLVKICRDNGADTHLIEEIEELQWEWFNGKRKIGITGGASTPMEYVDTVGAHIATVLSTRGNIC